MHEYIWFDETGMHHGTEVPSKCLRLLEVKHSEDMVIVTTVYATGKHWKPTFLFGGARYPNIEAVVKAMLDLYEELDELIFQIKKDL